MCKQHEGFAWDDTERGRFRQDSSSSEIPVIEHKPWVQRTIPIPPGIFDEVCRIIRKKIEAGVYDHPTHPTIAMVLRPQKGWQSVATVHSLEPLNAVTIQHSGVPPIPEHIAEKFGNRACGGMLDLYVGYDEREIAESSRDLTSFQTPYGALRLVTLPMGWTNAVPIFHDDVTYILQPEIPHITIPYIDDVPVRGPETRYELADGGYEVIATNPGIRRFVWEHMHSISRIVQRMRYWVNPDIAPSASINRWIVAILTFHFTLVHVPGTNHGPDGLSRRPRQPDDEDEPEDDFEDWIDRIHGFAHLVNPHPTQKVTRDSLVSIYTIDEPQPDSRHSSQVPEGEAESQDPPVDSYDIVPRSIQAIALDQSFYLFATGIEHSSDHTIHRCRLRDFC
ncbi:hypothetical protein A0H81_01162 [Grifola frondosa]|uniref:Uncharacterized protein n=1 Tax=Grifola frondosa TaxID=5627 RepID=A0A1C7MPV6_GRIFR|nr:hypothetical protein A0H81_01162 [Grifola frondosa]